MSYLGPLMEMKKLNGSGYDEFPLGWIIENSYKAAPNQRLDSSDSKRNTAGRMFRVVLDNEPTKVEFSLRPLTDADIAAFNSFMNDHYTVKKKREFVMRYFDVESGGYKEGTFYMSNPTYTIRQVDYHKKVIKYEETRIAFIEN